MFINCSVSDADIWVGVCIGGKGGEAADHTAAMHTLFSFETAFRVPQSWLKEKKTDLFTEKHMSYSAHKWRDD